LNDFIHYKNKFKPALSDDEISMIETPKGNWSIARTIFTA
jgi:hypothetical protein